MKLETLKYISMATVETTTFFENWDLFRSSIENLGNPVVEVYFSYETDKVEFCESDDFEDQNGHWLFSYEPECLATLAEYITDAVDNLANIEDL